MFHTNLGLDEKHFGKIISCEVSNFFEIIFSPDRIILNIPAVYCNVVVLHLTSLTPHTITTQVITWLRSVLEEVEGETDHSDF